MKPPAASSMTTLALEFSSSQRSVAVVRHSRMGDAWTGSEIVEAGEQSTRAFYMIDRALAEAHVERENVDTIAVGLGPGSYTGIRAAIAIAQGWQLARNVNLAGISSVEVLAAQAHHAGLRGVFHPIVDAQRGELYCSTWELSDQRYQEVQPLKIVPRDVIEDLLQDTSVVRGPDLHSSFPMLTEIYPSALFLGRLAVERQTFVAGECLKPIYLRETRFVKAPPPRHRL